MTDLEKRIYNSYLKISRQKLGKPYKLRQDFSGFEEDDKYIYIQKLSALLSRHSHIKLDDFFAAPYELYEEKIQYPLDFYTTMKAINAYSLNEKKKLRISPDEESQLHFIIESLNHIVEFVKAKNISIEDYVGYKTEAVPDFLVDIKNRKISLYVLFEFKNFEKVLRETGADIVKFILGDDIYETIDFARTKYLNSKIAKTLTKAAFIKIKLDKTNNEAILL
jgi:hypothetical protein